MKTTHLCCLLLATAALSAVSLAGPARVQACGGCFGPTSTVTVVTAHRMAVAISPAETTLWDQIQYAGSPAEFVWVLPIAGTNTVELSDNAFFEALDQATQIQLQGTFPPLRRFCPDPCAPTFGAGADAGLAARDGGPSSVTVYGEAVVGPYETVTIGSADPNALVDWLRLNGYAVPDAILPTIAHYVGLGMNFAALRLRPNAGVNQMQPVRITTPGMMPVFPLRMVAAGVVGKVGLELYVFAEGRYEAQNFPVVEIDPARLAYDWSTSSFNYGAIFDATIANNGGRAWVAEYAQPGLSWVSTVLYYDSYDDAGTRHRAVDDYAVVTRSISMPYLTKMRTDLAARFLDVDLVLQASMGGDVGNFVSVPNEVNRPAEPSCDPRPTSCGPTGPDGRPLGFSEGGGDGLCSVHTGSSHVPLWGLSIAALALVALRRRHRGAP